MTRLRRRVAPLIPALSALFAFTLAAPRPALVRHAHSGGEHLHAHAQPVEAAAAREVPLRHAEGFTRAGPPSATHTHVQQPFDFAVVAAPALVTVSLTLASLTPAAPRAPDAAAGRAAQARGPPAALPC